MLRAALRVGNKGKPRLHCICRIIFPEVFATNVLCTANRAKSYSTDKIINSFIIAVCSLVVNSYPENLNHLLRLERMKTVRVGYLTPWVYTNLLKEKKLKTSIGILTPGKWWNDGCTVTSKIALIKTKKRVDVKFECNYCLCTNATTVFLRNKLFSLINLLDCNLCEKKNLSKNSWMEWKQLYRW